MAEAPLIEDEARWTALLSHSSEILVIQRRDRAGTDFVSPNVEQILGYEPDDVAGRWTEIVHPDDVGAVLAAFDTTTASAQSRLRVRVLHAAGHLVSTDMTIADHSDDPLIRGLLVRVRDISDLVAAERARDRSEARLGAIVTRGPGATLLIDAGGAITFASRGLSRLFGWTPEEVIGRQGCDFAHPDDADKVLADFAALQAGDVTESTIRIRHRDGDHEWVRCTGINQLADADLEAIILTMHIVTDQVHADRRMKRLLRDSTGAAFVVTDDGSITHTTPGVEQFIGEHRVLTQEAAQLLFEPGSELAAYDAYWRVLRDGPGARARFLGRSGPDEDKRWVDIRVTNATDDPAIDGVIVNVRDVDDAVRAGETGNRLTEILENTTDLVCMYDGSFNRIWSNSTATRTFGPPAPMSDLERRQPPPATIHLRDEVIPTLEREGAWRGEIEVAAADGRTFPLEATMLAHVSTDGERFYSLMGRDISERKRLEGRLEAKARHDPLTGLPNRLFLSERLEADLARGEAVTLLFLDLDQFKAVNDSQGHDAGDQLLVTAAERLRGAIRPTDLVARFGGDEFVVLLNDIGDEDDAVAMAERILEHVRGPVQLGAIKVYLTGSVGVAWSDTADATTLISNADAAMYKAKADGRDRVAVFSDELRDRSQRRLETAHTLRSALDDDDLDVWFQPIIDTVTGRPVSVEALARWRHPKLGAVAPGDVIEVAEQTGLIVTLGSAVIRRTCADVAALGAAIGDVTFSVNLSAHQLTDPQLSLVLDGALRSHDLDPSRMVCEVTESAVMLDVARSTEVLAEIRALGIGIAIDDFGTGYSSLAYLQRFPVDVLKIDQEFVGGLTLDSDWQHSLAAGIISLGHSLGLRIVAEGVETDEQAEILTLLGCDAMQGYRYSAPRPRHELVAVLDELRTRTD